MVLDQGTLGLTRWLMVGWALNRQRDNVVVFCDGAMALIDRKDN